MRSNPKIAYVFSQLTADQGVLAALYYHLPGQEKRRQWTDRWFFVPGRAERLMNAGMCSIHPFHTRDSLMLTCRLGCFGVICTTTITPHRQTYGCMTLCKCETSYQRRSSDLWLLVLARTVSYPGGGTNERERITNFRLTDCAHWRIRDESAENEGLKRTMHQSIAPMHIHWAAMGTTRALCHQKSSVVGVSSLKQRLNSVGLLILVPLVLACNLRKEINQSSNIGKQWEGYIFKHTRAYKCNLHSIE